MDRMQRAAAIAFGILTPATDTTVAETVDELSDLLGAPGNFVSEAGVKLALEDAYPDLAIFHRADIASAHVGYRRWIGSTDFPAAGSIQWLDYVCSRFAAAGSDKDLAELVRIVRHRDGSTDAIAVGSEAHEALTLAALDAPQLLNRLKAVGLNLESGQVDYADLTPVDTREEISRADAVEASGALEVNIPAVAGEAADVPDALYPSRASVGATMRQTTPADVIALVVASGISFVCEVAAALDQVIEQAILPGPGFKWTAYLVPHSENRAHNIWELRLVDASPDDSVAAVISAEGGGAPFQVQYHLAPGTQTATVHPTLAAAQIAAAEYVISRDASILADLQKKVDSADGAQA